MLAESEPLEPSVGARKITASMRSSGAGMSLIGAESLARNLEKKKAAANDAKN